MVVFWKKQGFTAVLAIVVEANGHASGIWILTNGGNCLISIIDAMTQCVTVKITAGSFNWFFSAVYASPISSLWTHFWVQLITVRSLANGPWILIGESNEVIIPSETLGGAFSKTRAGRFREVMADCSLMDVGAVGHKFTWHRHVHGVCHIAKRLDRAIVDCEVWWIASCL